MGVGTLPTISFEIVLSVCGLLPSMVECFSGLGESSPATTVQEGEPWRSKLKR
jgi:hypothetical protein